MFRIGLITNAGNPLSKNFKDKDKADNWLLSIMETEGVKYYRVLDKKTGKIIEDEKGVRKNG